MVRPLPRLREWLNPRLLCIREVPVQVPVLQSLPAPLRALRRVVVLRGGVSGLPLAISPAIGLRTGGITEYVNACLSTKFFLFQKMNGFLFQKMNGFSLYAFPSPRYVKHPLFVTMVW